MLATTIHKSNTTPHHQRWSDNNQTPSSEADPNTEGHNTPGFPQSGRRGDGLVVSKPNSVSGNPSPEILTNPVPAQRLSCTRTTPTTGVIHPSNRSDHRTPTRCGRA